MHFPQPNNYTFVAELIFTSTNLRYFLVYVASHFSSFTQLLWEAIPF